jgi:hypothetical protein
MYVRYYAESECGRVTSNAVQITVTDTAHIANISGTLAICPEAQMSTILSAPEITDLGGLEIEEEGWIRTATQESVADAETFTLEDAADYAWNGEWVRYYVTNGCGTSYSNALQLTVHPAHNLTLSPNDTNVCYGAPITLTATTDLSAHTSYRWSCTEGGNLVAANAPQVQVVRPADGTHTYTVVVVDDETGCTDTAKVNISISTKSSKDSIVVCESELPYTYGNATDRIVCNRAGDYEVVFHTQEGCDSIVALHVDVRKPVESWTNKHVCSGGSFEWEVNGQTYSETTKDTVRVPYVTEPYCDSIIYYLSVTVNDLPSLEVSRPYATIAVGEAFSSEVNARLDCDGGYNSIKTAIEYELYKDGERIDSMGSFANIRLETEYAAVNGWFGKNLDYGYGEIPGTTFSIYNYNYDFFYIDFFNATRNRLTGTWTEPGEYKVVFRLVEMTGGRDIPYTYSQTNKLGGLGSTNTGNVLSEAEMRIYVGEIDNEYDTVTVCESATPYSYHGDFFSESGDHQVASELTIYNLHLTVIPTATSTTNVTTCASSYNWDGRMYTTSGTYTFETTSMSGCDSIATLNLVLNAPAEVVEDLTVEACDSYTWETNGETYYEDKYVEYVIPNGDCDEVHRLHLTVNSSSTEARTLVLTEQQLPYDYAGTSITEFGAQTITLSRANGCDSVINLDVVKANPFFTIVANPAADEVGETGSYDITLNGDILPADMKVGIDYEITHDGEPFTYVSEHGRAHFETKYSLMNNSWYGADLDNTTGSIPSNTFLLIYNQYNYFYMGFMNSTEHRLTMSWREPGEYVIRFRLQERTGGHDYAAAYDNDRLLPLGGYGSSNTGSTLATDSIVVRIAAPVEEITVDTTICNNALPFIYRGEEYTESMSTTINVEDPNEIYDTLITLNLTVVETLNEEYEAEVCAGEGYEGHGFTLSDEEIAEAMNADHVATFTYNGTSAAGCDSIVTLTITRNDIPEVTIDESITTFCAGDIAFVTATGADEYAWSTGDEGEEETILIEEPTDGMTVVVTGTTAGCSSSDTVILTVLPSEDIVINDTICQGETYEAEGFEITNTETAGLITEEIDLGYSDCANEGEGGNLYKRLNLYVAPVYNADYGYVDYADEVCAGSDYQGYGFTLTAEEIANSTAGVFYNESRTANGCDSITRLTLNVKAVDQTTVSGTICAGASYEFGEESLTLYSDTTFTRTYSNVGGCDSTVTYNVSVVPMPEAVIEGNTTVCSQGTVTLSTSVAAESIVWLVNGDSASTSAELQLENVTENAAVTLKVTYSEAYGCTSEQNVTIEVNELPTREINATICEGDVYAANGFNIEAPATGTYTRTEANPAGCDSLITLNLTVNTLDTTTESLTLNVEELPYIYHGTALTAGGQYYIHVPVAGGCDEVYDVTVTVNDTHGGQAFLTAGMTNDTIVLKAFSNAEDPSKKVAIRYTVFKDEAQVTLLTDECGGKLNISTEYLGNYYGKLLTNGVGYIPGNTFVLANNQYDYFYLHFLNARENVLTNTFTKNGDYRIEFELLEQEGGVDYALNYAASDGSLLRIGGKNTSDGQVLARTSISFSIEGQEEEEEEGPFPAGYPVLNITEANVTATTSIDTLTVSGNGYEETTKVAIYYTIYEDDEPVSYLSDVATVKMETYYATMNRYIGKNVTTATGSIPGNTFAPSSSYKYNYFYLHFLNNEEVVKNRINVTWKRTGNYKIAFDLVEMTGGSDFALTWTTGKKLGGKNATSTGLLLATDTIFYNITDLDAIAATISESATEEASSEIGLYPNPTNGKATLTLGRTEEPAVVRITDMNGKLMKAYTLEAGETQKVLNVEGWAEGVYFVTVQSADNFVTKKLVVTR